MSNTSGDGVTRLLIAWRHGDSEAGEALFSTVYEELRRIALGYFEREKEGHLLQPTALVHEAFLRLIDQARVNWQNRAHFFGIAATMMRRVLVDHARARDRLKRGGQEIRVPLQEALDLPEVRAAELCALDAALDTLATLDGRKSRLVELRFFAGLSVRETAEVLGCSPSTVAREWRLARAFIYRELGNGPAP